MTTCKTGAEHIKSLRDGRTAMIGVLICFDVAFEEGVYDLPNNGAQISVVQSSNAMYQGSSQVHLSRLVAHPHLEAQSLYCPTVFSVNGM